jgi:hypothetical protein
VSLVAAFFFLAGAFTFLASHRAVNTPNQHKHPLANFAPIAQAPCTPHQHVRRSIRVPRGARVKGKSVASRQPLVRAKNPWGAGEAESAHRGLGTRTVRETRSETETVSCRVGVPAPNPVPSAVRSYTMCVPRPIPNWKFSVFA